MKKIVLNKKEVGIVAAISGAILIAVWAVVYFYFLTNLKNLKDQTAGLKNQIVQIEEQFTEGKAIDVAIREMKDRQQVIDAKFPQKEEEALRMLSDLSKKFNMEILSIKPQPKADFVDNNSNKVMIEGRICQKLFVSVDLRVSYKELVEYIEALRESLPAYMTVEGMRIKKRDPKDVKLEVVLDLNLYLLS